MRERQRRETRQLSKRAITSQQLTRQQDWCDTRVHSIALGTCPCRQPQDLFLSLRRAAAGQIHNSLNRSLRDCRSAECEHPCICTLYTLALLYTE